MLHLPNFTNVSIEDLSKPLGFSTAMTIKILDLNDEYINTIRKQIYNIRYENWNTTSQSQR